MIEKLEGDVIISSLKTLKKTQGRQVIEDCINSELKEIEDSILSEVNEENNIVKYTEQDIKRIKRASLVMLLNYPEQIIMQMEDKLENENEDPYI